MRIVFATDGSRGAAVAEDFLFALPLSCADAVVVASAVTAGATEALGLVSRTCRRFAARSIPTTSSLRSGHPADVAEAVAFEQAADLVVIGSRGLGQWSGTLLGSVARTLARDGIMPLLVVRSRRDAPRRVLLAIDGSSDARAAIDLLSRLPLPSSATIAIARVGLAGDPRVALVLERARAVLGERVKDIDLVGEERIGEAVVRRALAGDADLVVLGTQGQTEGDLLHASVADHVLTHAHCAVLIAKAPVRTCDVRAPSRAVAAALT
ncbi:MAG TPA: universal stress protein [Candidatus Acidoferrales bacterium]|nr:universal stress protein [Candidatus Acidoferrales bacterium]